MPAQRGEIWYADLDPTEGHEQNGRRPVLILSVNSFNASRAELVAVLPVTTKPRPNNPFRIGITPPEGGVTDVSYVICEQVRTIATSRLAQQAKGTVSPVTMLAVEKQVRIVLGL